MAQTPTTTPAQDSSATGEGVLKDLKAGVSDLADRGTAAVAEALETGRDYADRVREAGSAYAGRVYETGQRRAEEAAFYAELGYEEARDWTRSHPLQALGLAAGIGLLVGLVVARR